MKYTQCWELYKAHTETFSADFDYYLEFCKNKTTLELFAGYGRLTNYLHKNQVDIEAVEIQPEFAKFISLQKEKIHVCDILKFKSNQKYQRIIAGYNSFCLINVENDIHRMFQMIDKYLCKEGIASLSYYDHNFWEGDYEEVFNFKGKQIIYKPTCDLSNRNKKIGAWFDRYYIGQSPFEFSFNTKLYESIDELQPYIKGTGLKIFETIKIYNKDDIYPGWLEFVLKKGG